LKASRLPVGFFFGIEHIGSGTARLAKKQRDTSAFTAASSIEHPASSTEEFMSEALQEFVISGSERLRVDRAAGVIRGVKLLGLASRNGRRYREDALVSAVALYEGAKVNVNHPKGHPLSPRDYQDRLGVVRGVEFLAGDGLFGDLHFNPKHPLSEQLVWDAEHAPQNVGMSHNVLARTSRDDGGTVVEAITKVQSIDLVADPATTNGLYEQVVTGASVAAATEPPAAAVRTLTLDQLREHRPDLIAAVEQAHESQLEQVRNRLDEALAQEELARRRERIAQLLEHYDLPRPAASSVASSPLVSQQFFDQLMRASDDKQVRQLVEERAALVRSACEWRNEGRAVPSPRPRSRDQIALQQGSGTRMQGAQEFAAALRVG
jgi:hypothetical protein